MPQLRLSRNLTVGCLSAAGIICLSSRSLLASEFADLKRLEPVPAAEQIPVIDFVRPQMMQQVQLNHDGTQIGAIVPGGADDHTDLIAYELATQKLDGVGGPSGDFDVAQFSWLDHNHLTYILTQKKMAGRALYLSEAGKMATSEQVAPPQDRFGNGETGISGQANVNIIDNPPEDRTQLLVVLSGFEYRYDHPEMINPVNHGALVVRYPELKTDHGFNMEFSSDKKGQLAFGVTQEDGKLRLSALQGENWVNCPQDLDQVDYKGSGDEPGQIVVVAERNGTTPRPLEFMDAVSGKPGEVILQDKSYDFQGYLFRDPLSHNIVGAVYQRAAPHVVWFTQEYRELQKLVDGLFPNQVVRILGMDDAGKVILINSGSDRQPEVFSWVNLETHKSGLIKNSQPWIDPKRMRPMGIYKFATAEGRQLDAYITLPAGATKANPPPAVVLTGYNSNDRFTWEYNAQAQFYASRGYAVIEPNHRGSSGYGWMYPEEEDWDLRKMNDDIAAGVRKAVDMGLVDGKRVAIIGTAFGGYFAAAGAAFEPGVYKCAVSLSGYYDWGKYLKEANYSKYNGPFYSRWLYKLGDPSRNAERFAAMSPLPHAGEVHSAVLIAWGEYDDPEWISQAKDFASAVGRSNPSETYSYLDEGGGLRHLAHKIDLNQHILDFLGKNL